MISRRAFLARGAAAGAALWLPAVRARAADAPLDASLFPPLEAQRDRPWLGLATSLLEEHDYEAAVEGRLPAALAGTLYRNGPGRFERDGLRKRCMLDGDGMLQAFRFDAGRVHYRNRFTRTAKWIEEEAEGHYRHATWSTLAPGGPFANLFGRAIANQAGVSAIVKHGRLYAFDESGAPGEGEPWELDPETLETLGRARLGGRSAPGWYAAHPKTDARTGEWLHCGLEYGRSVTAHLTTFARDGRIASERALELPRYAYLHDWFVTARWRVLHLHPVEVALLPFLTGFASLAGAFRWRPEQGSLLLLVPREGEGDPIALETDALFMWHALNAYDRGGEIVADFVGYEDPDHFIGEDPLMWTIMEGRWGRNAPGALRRFVIDPAGRRVRAETIAADAAYEFPIASPLRGCQRHRWAYLARHAEGERFWNEIVRVDTDSGDVERYAFGEGVYVGEPVFAPAPGSAADADPADERGWLLSEGYDGRRQRAFLVVLRAERVADGPLAVVHLQHHAPLSFHGWWEARGA